MTAHLLYTLAPLTDDQLMVHSPTIPSSDFIIENQTLIKYLGAEKNRLSHFLLQKLILWLFIEMTALKNYIFQIILQKLENWLLHSAKP